MIPYCAKHFTCTISHKREGKIYFTLHPQSPQAARRTQPAPTPPPGATARPAVLPAHDTPAGTAAGVKRAAVLTQDRTIKFTAATQLPTPRSHCQGSSPSSTSC